MAGNTRFISVSGPLVLGLITLGSSSGARSAGSPVAPTPLALPRLVVVISIDQFRADYLQRYKDLFLPPATGGTVGGFRYLMERGANFVDAHHDHIPLATGPGHAVLLTGAPPYKNGVVGNDWFDRAKKAKTYCVQDDDSPLVGTVAKGIGISPRNLLSSTVGDELKMATGGRSKVFGIAFKDRAAVLMAGHLADGAYWFDSTTGDWITSRYFRKTGMLAGWARDINSKKIPDSYFHRIWTPIVERSAFERAWTPAGNHAVNLFGMGTDFPHPLNGGSKEPGKSSYSAFTYTPYGNGFVLDSAEKLIRAEKLGQGTLPDLLAISLSSNDYIGHVFGPDSPEVLDLTVQTDRMLSKFLNDLNGSIPGGLPGIVVVMTADHGMTPIAESLKSAGMPGGLWDPKEVAKAAQDALSAEFGQGHWLEGFYEPYLWLDLETLKRLHITREKAEDVAAGAIETLPGIYAAYTRHNVLAGLMPRTEIASDVELGWHSQNAGDVAVICLPHWSMREDTKAAEHGMPYSYDTHVPLLLAGFGIRAGTYTDRVSTRDLAPTLSLLLRIGQPGGCEGHILTPALAISH